jgi:hypothetical protein
MVETFNPPTREQLSRVSQGDERLLRALEELFRSAGRTIPDDLSGIDDSIAALQAAPEHGLHALSGLSRKQDAITALVTGQLVFVADKYDLPKPVAGVITLADSTIYSLTCDIDLLGDRIVGGVDNVIEGWGPTVSSLLSTGLTGTALITSTENITLRHIDISADVALDLNGSAGKFLDWLTVNFTDCPTVGTIQNYDNFIGLNIGVIDSANWTFDGTIGTIGFGDSLFSGIAGETTLIIPATAIITRRFRPKFSAFITPTGGTGIDFSTSATVPDEDYILFECDFSGAGTALAGVQFDDNKAMFKGNTGIENSRTFANYYMTNNATTTPVVVSTPTKALGTTTSNPISQRFSFTDNRATYVGAPTRDFEVEAWASLSSNNNNVLRLYIAKNGTAVTTSFAEGTANAGGRAEGLVTASVVELDTNDYVEVFVSNETSGNNVLDINLNVIVSEL